MLWCIAMDAGTDGLILALHSQCQLLYHTFTASRGLHDRLAGTSSPLKPQNVRVGVQHLGNKQRFNGPLRTITTCSLFVLTIATCSPSFHFLIQFNMSRAADLLRNELAI